MAGSGFITDAVAVIDTSRRTGRRVLVVRASAFAVRQDARSRLEHGRPGHAAGRSVRRMAKGRVLPAKASVGVPHVPGLIRNRKAPGRQAAPNLTAMDITIHSSLLPHPDPDVSLAFFRDTLRDSLASPVLATVRLMPSLQVKRLGLVRCTKELRNG
jgi:hypothetical protein